MKGTSWLLGLVVGAQVVSCAIAPALVVRPTAEVLGACETWAAPTGADGETFWCVPAGQGDSDPSGWLGVVALGTLVVTSIIWLLPGAILIVRVHDHRMARSPL